MGALCTVHMVPLTPVKGGHTDAMCLLLKREKCLVAGERHKEHQGLAVVEGSGGAGPALQPHCEHPRGCQALR